MSDMAVYWTDVEWLHRAVVHVSVHACTPPAPAHTLPALPDPHPRVNTLRPPISDVDLEQAPVIQGTVVTPVPALLNLAPDPQPLASSSPVPTHA